MTTNDVCTALTRLLDEETVRLDELLTALRAERDAFVALRPSEIEAGARRLAEITEQSQALAQRRDELASGLARSLGLEATPRLRRLLPHLPEHHSDALRRAAAAAAEKATAVRIELRAGQRLLEFSRRSNEHLMRALRGGDEATTGVYDRRGNVTDNGTDRTGLLSGTV